MKQELNPVYDNFENELSPEGQRFTARQDLLNETLTHINLLFKACIDSAIQRNYDQWSQCLKALNRITYEITDEEDKKKIKANFDAIDTEITKIRNILQFSQAPTYTKLEQSCEDTEILLRKTLQKRNLIFGDLQAE